MEYNVKNLEEKKDTAQETIKITDKTTQNIPTKLEENLTSLSFENFEFKFSNYLKILYIQCFVDDRFIRIHNCMTS